MRCFQLCSAMVAPRVSFQIPREDGVIGHSIEDQGGNARLEDVHNRFGERVARVVQACSDSLADTAKGERKAHWKERKEAYLAHLRTADDDILRVSLADKVHN